MISVGFCAILVGLGVDFAILTIGRYHQARADGEPHQQAIATSVAKLGRAVFFGALTTAVGFLALVLSGAMSFSELGVLIAIGIFVAGLFMCSILFLFVRERQGAVGRSSGETEKTRGRAGGGAAALIPEVGCAREIQAMHFHPG